MPSFSAGVRTLSFGMMPLFLMVCFTHRFYPLAIQHLNKNWCAKNDLLDHPWGDVALTMKNTPDVHVIFPLHIENQVWEAMQRQKPQSRQVQFVVIPGRARCRISANLVVRRLHGIDEPERRFGSVSLQVILNGLLHIPVRLRPRNHRFRIH